MRSAGWLQGLCRRRGAALVGAGASIALAVAFSAALGAFVTESRAGLTNRAAARVPVDWQVQVTPQGRVPTVATALARTPGVRAVLPVQMARVPGLRAASSAGTRTTGAAYVVALPADYARRAPAEIRYLLGPHSGVLLQQQTAANLSAGPRSAVTILLPGGARSTVRVDGVIDLPQADSFFQVVGAPAGAGATAPPDNVVLVPPGRFAALTRGTTTIHQFHVLLSRSPLPHDPAAAATLLSRRVNNLQVRVAGGALVGDNLGAALSAAREDALYAQLLVLLLGLPGLALAASVAALVVALRGRRRSREISLLRLWGASVPAQLRLLAAETVVTCGIGIALGLPLALLAVRLALPADAHVTTLGVLISSGLAVIVAGTTQLAPAAYRALRAEAGSGRVDENSDETHQLPAPLRFGLDALLLAGAGLVFFLTARGGYRVVVVPEGVPVASVNYAALLAPALAWPGLALLIWRAGLWALSRRSGRFGSRRPGRAPELTAAGVRRRRRPIARGVAGLAIALGLAASTAVFTATYDQQARLDVALTVGADVAVTEPPGASVRPAAGVAYASAPGVSAVEPLQHRLAYVGTDLQDLYGISPATIGRVAPLQDSFVPGSTIASALHDLAATPDGVLLSTETIADYQLRPGDPVRLRLQAGPSRAYRTIDFHVVGVVTEFPTAPRDSFIVADAGYIARVTGSNAVGTFLIKSSRPQATASALRPLVPPGGQVHDITTDRTTVTSASGLASADLSGLARLELGFGLLFATACSGLTLALGVVERRRGLVLLAALGATSRQRGRFVAAEAQALLVGGLIGGAAIAAIIAYLLVKVLNGIFDPPPSGLTVPAAYLGVLVAVVVGGASVVLTIAGRLVGSAGPETLRDL